MIVSKYPNWTATVLYKDGHAHHFDGAKDMFKYLQDLPKYAPGIARKTSRRSPSPTSTTSARLTRGRPGSLSAWMSLGPMGHEFVPLANRMDAEEFIKDHKGKRALAFEQVTAQLVDQVDNGRF